MNTSISTAQYELQTTWFVNETNSISETQSMQQPAGNLNPIKWVAGHVLNTRMMLVGLINGTGPNPQYSPLFGKGSTGKVDESFPSLEEIKTKWHEVAVELTTAIKNMSEAQLASPPPFQTSIPDKTWHGLIVYLAAHEAFHIGQLSILKKLV